MKDRIRVREDRLLSKGWSELRSVTFDYHRRDGDWQTMTREVYDRGHGAVILPYDPVRGTVLLIRQFRYAAYVAGYTTPMIEAVAGLLDDTSPEETIRREAEEEAGCRIGEARKVFESFMSPGSVTERLTFFVAPYSAADRVGAGGGLVAEGEDIEVLEPTLDEALAMVADGRIVDAKTIMLLQYAKLNGLVG
ncbi:MULTISPECIES: NUDIX domain-containing protein [Nitrospirillum]|uniref:GDP-mannose pyrophosphatase n=1 Tax=Nitrospirillum amazonense TaxID=28077 RepID=A0A560EMA7_9PROT|nr:NUDIX domain-containing protein [Nitrospirillum amazonense]EGX99977.1 GDP-mannose pyrophosphatase nudK [Nitrospirillum amazonense Y2]MEC4590088.1 NUDIX domain-containing protein [Nitrospirillum amazonense]TWB10499.1 nudix-type nucleoside diphosphatase (YffH/AdpP family) [Nitrospirillum amazonense]TWB25031.1 nudix-type nucleoside diphosphatase (YffH/AdpP family) [Nitrospirillum amazonense]TWB56590.1 nudix-type nucleoside diphosphatase (YffH/AdpP family) [Nitrospirillum amazonense]